MKMTRCAMWKDIYGMWTVNHYCIWKKRWKSLTLDLVSNSTQLAKHTQSCSTVCTTVSLSSLIPWTMILLTASPSFKNVSKVISISLHLNTKSLTSLRVVVSKNYSKQMKSWFWVRVSKRKKIKNCLISNSQTSTKLIQLSWKKITKLWKVYQNLQLNKQVVCLSFQMKSIAISLLLNQGTS